MQRSKNKLLTHLNRTIFHGGVATVERRGWRLQLNEAFTRVGDNPWNRQDVYGVCTAAPPPARSHGYKRRHVSISQLAK